MLNYSTRSIAVALTLMLGATMPVPSASTAQSPVSRPARPLCAQWDLSGHWELPQSTGGGKLTVTLDLQQSGSRVTGQGKYPYPARPGPFGRFGGDRLGTVEGTVQGTRVTLVIRWENGSVGEYTGHVDSGGGIAGTTIDLTNRQSVGTWYGSNRVAGCASFLAAGQAPARPTTAPGPTTKPVKKLGKARSFATANNDVDIYDGPGGEFNVIGIMRQGESALVTGSQEGWHKLQFAALPGGTGWVASDHLSFRIQRP